MAIKRPEFAWAYGFWLSDRSTKLGIANKNLELIKEFQTVLSKSFPEFNSPEIWVYLKREMNANDLQKLIKEISNMLNVEKKKIKIYINPRQYGERVINLITNKKTTKKFFFNLVKNYEKVLGKKRELAIALMSGKLDGDGNVNVSRGIIEWYYISDNSVKQVKKDAFVLNKIGLNPSVRKHKKGFALVLGSLKKNFKEVIWFSKEALKFVKSKNKRKSLKKLALGERVRQKDLKILGFINEGFNSTKTLEAKLNYAPRTLRQILQNLTDQEYVKRIRNRRNEPYVYTITTKGLEAYSGGTKDESVGSEPDEE